VGDGWREHERDMSGDVRRVRAAHRPAGAAARPLNRGSPNREMTDEPTAEQMKEEM